MRQNLLNWGSKTSLLHTDTSLYSKFVNCCLIRFIALLRGVLDWWVWRVVIFGWGFGFFFLAWGRIQRPPDTLEEVRSWFKGHITPREQCCMGLLTLPFSLTFHHKMLGLNMTIDNVLPASINTLEQRMWGVLHRFFAICFTDISTWEKQSLLCTNVGFSSVPILKATSLKSGMHLCFKKWYNLSMEHMCKLWSVCTWDSKNWQVQCWTALMLTTSPCMIFYCKKFCIKSDFHSF